MSGTIDTTYGTGGTVNWGTTSNTSNIVQDANNNTIVGGQIGSQYLLVRYLPSGVLDTTFGNLGVVQGYFSGSDTAKIQVVAIDNNNNIVVAGSSLEEYAVARFLPSGVLDTTFGTNGIVVGYFSGTDLSTVKSLNIDSNNNIIIGGNVTTQYVLARFLPTGIADSSFGSGGFVIGYFLGTSTSTVNTLAIYQTNIIVGGYVSAQFVLASYLTNGNIDTSFGTGGMVIGYFSGTSNSLINSLVLDSNNNIVIGGSCGQQYTLGRYLINGSLDTTFGTGGIVLGYFNETFNSSIKSIVIDNSSNIIVGGTMSPPGEYALMRFLPTSEIDTTFNGGVTYGYFIGTQASYLTSVSIDKQGNIMVGGYSIIYSGGPPPRPFYTDVLVRFLSSDSPPSPPTPPPPISDICFPGNTPIQTDQGEFPIASLNPEIHTINGNQIVAITRTISTDKQLVCIEDGTLGTNIPRQTTIMSKNHRVYNGRTFVSARKLVGKLHGVKLVPYSGEVLYNVLLEEYGIMNVNGMICETLNPNNIVARFCNNENIASIVAKINAEHRIRSNRFSMRF